MANTILQRFKLSGAPDGNGPIGISAVAPGGTSIHTCITGSLHFDQVMLWAHNSGSAGVTLTLELSGSSGHQRLPTLVPPGSGSIIIGPGHAMNNGAVISAYASTSGSLLVYGFVDRLSVF